jgi:hypothetical protein
MNTASIYPFCSASGVDHFPSIQGSRLTFPKSYYFQLRDTSCSEISVIPLISEFKDLGVSIEVSEAQVVQVSGRCSPRYG